MKYEVEKYEKELKDLKEKLSQEEQKLNNEKEKYNDLLKEKVKDDKIQLEIEKQSAEIQKNNELLRNKENELASMKEKIKLTEEKYKNEINKYISEHQKREEELKEEIEKYKKNINESFIQIKSKDEKIKLYEEQLNYSNENMKKSEEKYNKEKIEFEEKIKEHENKINILGNDIEKNKKEINEKKEVIKKLEEDLKIKEDLLISKEKEIKEKEELIIKKKNENQLYNSKLKESEEKILSIEKQSNNDIKEIKEKLKSKEELLNSETDKYKEEISKFSNEIKLINEKLKEKEEELKNEKEKYEKLMNENSEKIKNQEQEIKSKEEQNKSELENKLKEIKAKEELINNKENEINSLKQKSQKDYESFKIEKSGYIKTIEELKSEIKKYKEQLNLKDSLTSNSEQKIKEMEEQYNKEKREFEKQIKDNEIKIKTIEELSKVEAEKNKKNMNEKNDIIKKLEQDIKNKTDILNKKEEEINNIKNNNNILEGKIKSINEENNIKLKQSEVKNKNEEERIKLELEKNSKLINEIKGNNEKLQSEIENYKKELLKKDEEYQTLIKEKNSLKENLLPSQSSKNNETTNLSLSKENQELLPKILSDILLKLNFSKYLLNIFDILTEIDEKYEKLNYIKNAYQNLSEPLDYIFHFYLLFKAYFTIGQEKASFEDLLSQSNFIFPEDNSLIEQIKSLNLGNNIHINELYEQKREDYMKKMEIKFHELKQKMMNDVYDINNKKKNEKKIYHFLKVKEPKFELEVNFDELNKDSNIAKFQVFNSFSKLKELTLLISNFPIFLIYSLIVNCNNLHTLKLYFITEKSKDKNNKNIENICEAIPILLKYMNKLESLELINFPIKPNKVPELSEALKTSNIKKLSLINCFPKKDGVNSLIPYFSFPSKNLTDITISEYNFNIISFLSNSILNIQFNKNLTSITFNDCKLTDEDINHISNFIVSSSSLLYCDISQNILSAKSCSQFGYCILKTTSLETLKLNECGINGESLLFLFNAKGSKCIKKVYLNGNDFGDIGLVSIGAFLKSSPELEIIEVKKCKGTDMGFINLANSIKVLQSNKLKSVNYQHNNITNMALGILTQFNDVFKNKGVVFTLNKIPGETDKIKLDCAVFS